MFLFYKILDFGWGWVVVTRRLGYLGARLGLRGVGVPVTVSVVVRTRVFSRDEESGNRGKWCLGRGTEENGVTCL